MDVDKAQPVVVPRRVVEARSREMARFGVRLAVFNGFARELGPEVDAVDRSDFSDSIGEIDGEFGVLRKGGGRSERDERGAS